MKRLNEMSSEERIDFWVHNHTANSFFGCGESERGKALKSANRLVDKICAEIKQQRVDSYRRGQNSASFGQRLDNH